MTMLSLQAKASYYDVIGLLIVRDKMESVEGVPLEAFAKHPIYSKKSILSNGSNSGLKMDIPLKSYPPAAPSEDADLEDAPVKYHGILDHSPMSSSIGSYSKELSTYKSGMLPMPAGGFPFHQINGPAEGDTSGPGMAGVPNAPGNAPNTSGHHPSGISTTGSIPPKNLQGNQQRLFTKPARVVTKHDPSKYPIEVCPICSRPFPGPKAATHKQQHIRRLHPADYRPKKGGKNKKKKF